MVKSSLEEHHQTIEALARSKPIHEMSDISRAIDSYESLFLQAEERNALYPYLGLANTVLGMLVLVRDNLAEPRTTDESVHGRAYELMFESASFSILLGRDEAHAALQELSPQVYRMQYHVDAFAELSDAVERDIAVEVLANKIVGRQYLAEGKLIVAPTTETTGYHVLTLKTALEDGEINCRVNSVTRGGYATLRDAIRRHVDPARLETVVVVQQTEKYPMAETVMPTILQHYIAGLGEKEA